MSETILVDARGLACPMPVVLARKALDSARPGDDVAVLVDNEAARDNVSRMAGNAGCGVQVLTEPGGFRIRISVAAKKPDAAGPGGGRGGAPNVVVYVNGDKIGRGSEELGGILMRAFLQTLKSAEPRPSTLVLLNSGVRLAADGSPLLLALKELEASGIAIHSCGTCLDYFKLLDKLRVGVVSNMYEIVGLLSNADRVVQP